MEGSAAGWLVTGYFIALPTVLAWLLVGPRWALHICTLAVAFQVLWLQVQTIQEVVNCD